MILIGEVGPQIEDINLLLCNAADLAKRRWNRHVGALTARGGVIPLAVILIRSPEVLEQGDDLVVTPLIRPVEAGLLLEVLLGSGEGDLGAPDQEVDAIIYI